MANTTCDLGGFLLEMPPAWKDQSMLIFEEPAPSKGVPANIVVTRRSRDADEPLQQHMWKRVLDTSRRVAGFEVLDFAPTEVAGRAAVRVRFHWKPDKEIVEESLLAIDLPDGCVITFTLSTTREPDLVSVDAFARVVGSIVMASQSAPSSPILRGDTVR